MFVLGNHEKSNEYSFTAKIVYNHFKPILYFAGYIESPVNKKKPHGGMFIRVLGWARKAVALYDYKILKKIACFYGDQELS